MTDSAQSSKRPNLGISERFFSSAFRRVLGLSRRHGQRTLGRINHWLFPEGQHFRLPTGNPFFLPPDPHFFGYMVGHESHISEKIMEIVHEGSTCVDVGANIGYFTLQMAARCGHEGLVIAYEPEPANFAMLAANANIAREEGLSIRCHQVAVSSTSGTASLVRGDESTAHSITTNAPSGPDGQLEEIKTVSLDDDLRGLPTSATIRLVKIDVEGHEFEALAGMQELLSSGRIEHAIIEVTPGEPAMAVSSLLNRHRDQIEKILCWVDGRWIEAAVGEMEHRTDIHVHFRSRPN